MSNSPTKILVVNAGSSSVKYTVFDTVTNQQVAGGGFEKVEDVAKVIASIPGLLKEQGHSDLMAIAHRVAHGGARYSRPCILTDETVAQIEELNPLAPLHNPPAISGIKTMREVYPGLPQLAVFDTAFHTSIPAMAYTYAVPKEWREKGLRRYGFHGTSHKYIMLRAAQELGDEPENLRIISCHLGNGASVCAIQYGASVDTSMGMTPLEGITMGTRCGDLDPGAYLYLKRTLGLTVEEIETALYKKSGLQGLSGVGNDLRDISKAAEEGNRDCQLALQVFAYRVSKYIGAYAAAMGGVDAVVFTGGIGERSASMRKRICDRLEFMGLMFDDDRNEAVTNKMLDDNHAPCITAEHSRVKTLVIQSRETWMIFQEAKRLLNKDEDSARADHTIPIAVSARHVHLTQEAVEALFGPGYKLKIFKELKQPGNWASVETVDVVGPRGTLEGMRILGPCRDFNQVEVSRTDSFKLGIEVPVRNSGKIDGTPTVTIRGPYGSINTRGLIIAARHIHYSEADALRDGVKDGEIVDVEVTSGERPITFHNVLVRASDKFITEMHIDTDEGNASELEHGGYGVVVKRKPESKSFTLPTGIPLNGVTPAESFTTAPHPAAGLQAKTKGTFFAALRRKTETGEKKGE